LPCRPATKAQIKKFLSCIFDGMSLRMKFIVCKWLEPDIATTAAGNGRCPASPVAEIHATGATPICAFV
jgi:hypothetical protein